jgi:hypothetical protein
MVGPDRIRCIQGVTKCMYKITKDAIFYYLIQCESDHFSAEIYGSESFLDYSSLHVGSITPGGNVQTTSSPPLIGYIQQLVMTFTKLKCTLYNYKEYPETGLLPRWTFNYEVKQWWAWLIL